MTELPVEERVARVLAVLDETPTGPPEVVVAPGPVPASLSLTLSAPMRSRCRVLVARRARQQVSEAEVTYVPSRRVLKHGLAFSFGVAVFAPVWLPLHYHGCAAERAELAVDDASLAGSQLDDTGGCFVTRVDRAQVAGDWVEDETAVERDLTRVAPLRGAPVRVRRPGRAWAWRGSTDGLGRVVVSRASLGASDGPLEVEAGGVVARLPASAWAPPAPPGASEELEAALVEDGLEAVVRRVAAAVGSGALAPDAPAARALPSLLRRRGGPLPLADAARADVEAAARGLRQCAAAPAASELAAIRRHLEAALQAAPGCWEAHRLLGVTARLAGDEPAAVNHLRIALCLLPETSPLVDRVAAELLPR